MLLNLSFHFLIGFVNIESILASLPQVKAGGVLVRGNHLANMVLTKQEEDGLKFLRKVWEQGRV